MTKEQMMKAERCMPFYDEDQRTEAEIKAEWEEFERYVEEHGYPVNDELPF